MMHTKGGQSRHGSRRAAHASIHPSVQPSITLPSSIRLAIHPKASLLSGLLAAPAVFSIFTHTSPRLGSPVRGKNSRRAPGVRRRDVGLGLRQGRACLFKAAFIYG